MQKQTAHIRVYGIVQGVGFRFTTQMLANKYGIGGWVANLPDGSVEMEATGTKDELDAFREAIRSSRVGSGIDRWEEKRRSASDAPLHFDVR